MARKPTSRVEKLLNRMRKTPMTRKQMVEFLLGGKENYLETDRGTFNATLYGTRDREGILERYTRQLKDGSYKTVRPVKGPFTRQRATPRVSTVQRVDPFSAGGLAALD